MQRLQAVRSELVPTFQNSNRLQNWDRGSTILEYRTGIPGPVLCYTRWTSSPLQVPNFRGLVWTAGTVLPALPIPDRHILACPALTFYHFVNCVALSYFPLCIRPRHLLHCGMATVIYVMGDRRRALQELPLPEAGLKGREEVVRIQLKTGHKVATCPRRKLV